MSIDVGQGGGLSSIGSWQGNRLVIDGQGCDPATGLPYDMSGPVCFNYSGMRRNFPQPDMILDISRSYYMDVVHKGKNSFKGSLTNCQVSLTLGAAKNDITVGNNGSARITLKGAGALNLTMSGTPDVVKNADGTCSISSGSGYIDLSGPIGLVKINGKTLQSYLPAEAEGNTGATGATGATGSTGATGAAKQYTGNITTGADIMAGRNRNGLNGGSSFGNTQSQSSQSTSSQSSGSLTTDPPMSKSSGAANGWVVSTTVSNSTDPAQKSSVMDPTQSQDVSAALDSRVNQQATRDEINAKMAANAASQVGGGGNASSAQQNMFPPNLPPMYQILMMFLGILQQQSAQQNPGLNPYQQNSAPWR